MQSLERGEKSLYVSIREEIRHKYANEFDWVDSIIS